MLPKAKKSNKAPYAGKFKGAHDDQKHLSKATRAALDAALHQMEQGLPGEITTVRSVTCLEDALQMLQEERDEAEEV